jgi:hypothetical protein
VAGCPGPAECCRDRPFASTARLARRRHAPGGAGIAGWHPSSPSAPGARGRQRAHPTVALVIAGARSGLPCGPLALPPSAPPRRHRRRHGMLPQAQRGGCAQNAALSNSKSPRGSPLGEGGPTCQGAGATGGARRRVAAAAAGDRAQARGPGPSPGDALGPMSRRGGAGGWGVKGYNRPGGGYNRRRRRAMWAARSGGRGNVNRCKRGLQDGERRCGARGAGCMLVVQRRRGARAAAAAWQGHGPRSDGSARGGRQPYSPKPPSGRHGRAKKGPAAAQAAVAAGLSSGAQARAAFTRPPARRPARRRRRAPARRRRRRRAAAATACTQRAAAAAARGRACWLHPHSPGP